MNSYRLNTGAGTSLAAWLRLDIRLSKVDSAAAMRACNPASQARDLAIFDPAYIVDKVQPIDMFPHTHHVENVVRLVRKK